MSPCVARGGGRDGAEVVGVAGQGGEDGHGDERDQAMDSGAEALAPFLWPPQSNLYLPR